jgi:hypothetical protein
MSSLQRKPYTRLQKDSEHIDIIRSLLNESDNAFRDLDVGALIYQAVREYARDVASVGATSHGTDDWTQTAVSIDMLLDTDIENICKDAQAA